MPAVGKACVKVPLLLLMPESQMPSTAQPGEQAPDVVEWVPPPQVQSTVSPALIVVVLLPLTESVNRVLVMLTLAVAACAAVATSAAAKSASQRALIRNVRDIEVSIGVSLLCDDHDASLVNAAGRAR